MSDFNKEAKEFLKALRESKPEEIKFYTEKPKRKPR